MDGCCAGCMVNLLLAHLALDTVGDVLANGAREQEGLLLNNPDMPAQVAS